MANCSFSKLVFIFKIWQKAAESKCEHVALKHESIMRDVLLVGQSPTSSSKQEVGCQACTGFVLLLQRLLQSNQIAVFEMCGLHYSKMNHMRPYMWALRTLPPHKEGKSSDTPTKSRIGAVNIAEPAKNKSSAGLTPDLSFYWKRLGSTQLIYYMVLSEE